VLRQLFDECATNIANIRHLLQIQNEMIIGREDREYMNDLWARVCYRLDIYALVITESVNAAILIVWMSIEP
jgi:hypothetical protein